MNTEYYYPHSADRLRREEWEEKGSLDMRQRARQRAQDILDSYQPERIAPEIDTAIRERFEIVLPPELAGVGE
jgi:trimethylamine--corrinoid protein Co-methyltransferase